MGVCGLRMQNWRSECTGLGVRENPTWHVLGMVVGGGSNFTQCRDNDLDFDPLDTTLGLEHSLTNETQNATNC